MPWPPSVTVITVNGRIVHADVSQTPAVGFVRFTTPNILRDITDDVILVETVTEVILDINGEFTVDLPATNDPDIDPIDWAIKVFVSTDAWREQFFIHLDHLGPNPIEFSDITAATDGDCGTGLVTCVTVAQLQASAAATLAAANAYTDAEIAALPPAPVLSVNGETGVVILDAADVGADAAGTAAAAVAALNALVVHLAGAENITGVKTFTADPVFNAGAIPQAAVVNLAADLASKAVDALVVHLAGVESITGVKTFTADPVFNVGGIAQAAVAGLVADLAARVVGPAAATDTAVARYDGVTGKLIKDSVTTTLTDGGELVNRGDVFVRKADASGEFAQRVSGGGLDYDAAGYDWFFSVWTGTGVGLGTQRVYIRAEQGAELLHAVGRWIWATGPFGGAVHALDPVTGVAELGGKNGLTTINLVGRGAVAGAPAAGAWNVGDLMIDSVGVWHYCTVAGTPGTWT